MMMRFFAKRDQDDEPPSKLARTRTTTTELKKRLVRVGREAADERRALGDTLRVAQIHLTEKIQAVGDNLRPELRDGRTQVQRLLQSHEEMRLDLVALKDAVAGLASAQSQVAMRGDLDVMRRNLDALKVASVYQASAKMQESMRRELAALKDAVHGLVAKLQAPSDTPVPAPATPEPDPAPMGT